VGTPSLFEAVKSKRAPTEGHPYKMPVALDKNLAWTLMLVSKCGSSFNDLWSWKRNTG